MRTALGLNVHTGWVACVVAGGSLDEPRIEHRERLELLDDTQRFVFHRAAEMSLRDAHRAITKAREAVVTLAAAALRRIESGHDVSVCAIVAKPGAMPAIETVLGSHARIHAAEGIFYRDALLEAAVLAEISARVVPPAKVPAKHPRLAEVGRIVGKPWNADWKIAALAAWQSLSYR
jgi:hypothetical protein